MASTLHATGRLTEAESVLSRVLRVCPGDIAARRLMARVTDAANAPLRQHERHVNVPQDNDPFNDRPPHSKQPTTNGYHPQSSGQRAPAADFPWSQPVWRAGAYTCSRGLHLFPFQLNSSSSVHRRANLTHECVLELLKLSREVDQCKPLMAGGRRGAGAAGAGGQGAGAYTRSRQSST